MCGIAGLVNLHGEPSNVALLERMAAELRHRGPDAHGVQALGQAGIAHTRLSIIDLSGGAQPMHNEDATLWITFNGEIFNFVELREELLKAGHRFATKSDTEVIIHAYEEWGPDCVKRFNGQWAFVLWDTHKRELFASRDRFGVRPFYYAKTEKHFVFGSEIKAIFAHPEIPRKLDLRGLDHVFTFWCITAPRTAFEGISELPPGHSLRLRGGAVEVFPYWEIDYPEPDENRTEESYAEELRALLVDSARLRLLRADVPVGAYLSGGIDSTVITSVVKNFTEQPLRTFSVTFQDPEFDESSFQSQAVDYLGIRDHHSALCTASDIGRVFPDVVWHSEQPIVRTAPAPLFLLAKLVRERDYKVVLTGEGSDELLGGYDIFKEAKVRRFWARQPESRIRPLLLKKLYPYITNLQQQSPAYLKAFFHVRPEDLASPFFSHLPRWELTSKSKLFYGKATQEALTGYDALEELRGRLPKQFSTWSHFCQAQYLETAGLMPGYILSSQGDRMAMAHGIEGRFPFLDVRVAELSMRIPPRFKMKRLNEKNILKKAAADIIPPFLQKRPKQPYRAEDVPSFFDATTQAERFSYVADMLSPEAIRRAGVFNPDAVSRLVDKAKKGGVIGVKDGMALVTILSTQLLNEQFITTLGRLSA